MYIDNNIISQSQVFLFMGAKQKKRLAFFKKHPTCCFCGGKTPALEIDHLPSRACFDGRQFPEGFEFPACRQCNGSTDQDEQWVALLSRFLPHPNEPSDPTELARYMNGVKNNNPTLFFAMKPITVQPGVGVVMELPPDGRKAFERVVERWGKAFHYMETGRIVPSNAKIQVGIYFNTEEPPESAFFGPSKALKRNGKSLLSQMEYVSLIDPSDDGLGRYTVMFRRSFCAVVIVDCDGKLPINSGIID